MIFIENKYTRIYNNIIEQANSRTLPDNVYTERHHIIPKSLGGSNSKDNLVELTAREHFVCHWLLTKMTAGKDASKMWHALRCFTFSSYKNKRYDYKINSKLYEIIKIKQAEVASTDHKGNFYWNNGKIQIKSNTCPGKDFKRGRLVLEKKKWWTNGTENKWQAEALGKDWYNGRTLSKKPNSFKGKKHSEKTKQQIRKARSNQNTLAGKKVKIIDSNRVEYTFESVVDASRKLFGSDEKYGKLSHLVRLCNKGSVPRSDSEFYGWHAEFI